MSPAFQSKPVDSIDPPVGLLPTAPLSIPAMSFEELEITTLDPVILKKGLDVTQRGGKVVIWTEAELTFLGMVAPSAIEKLNKEYKKNFYRSENPHESVEEAHAIAETVFSTI